MIYSVHMGMTAMWMFAAGLDPDAAPPEWEPLTEVRPGWLGVATMAPDQPGILPEDASPQAGPATLLSYVEDSGFCVLTVIGEAQPHWRWVINDEHFISETHPDAATAYGLPPALTGDDDRDDLERAARRGRVVPLMVEWAGAAGLPAPDPVQLDEVLDREYLPAETGFFALLDALGLVAPAAAPESAPVEVVEEELPPLLAAPVRERRDHWVLQRSGPRFAFQIDTYADLLGQLDDVADWVDALRPTFIEPAVERATSLIEFVPGPRVDDDEVSAGALRVHLNIVTMKGRYRDLAYNDRTWRRVVRDLRKGLLRGVTVNLQRYDSAGRAAAATAATVRFDVELRSPLVDEPTGRLPNGFPAYFIASVSRPSEGQPPVAMLMDLMRSTAARFDAACGFLTADTAGLLRTYGVSDSPYESRSGAHTYPHRRLDEITRGMHWCNIFSTRHLDAAGGVEALRETGLFHRIEPIDGSDLWWLQLTAEPNDLHHATVDQAAWAMRAVMPRLRNGNIGLTERTET